MSGAGASKTPAKSDTSTTENTPTTKGYGQRLTDAPKPDVTTAVVTYTPRFSGKYGKNAATKFIDLLKEGKIPFVRLGAVGEFRIQEDVERDEHGKIIKETYRVKQTGVTDQAPVFNIDINNSVKIGRAHV